MLCGADARLVDDGGDMFVSRTVRLRALIVLPVEDLDASRDLGPRCCYVDQSKLLEKPLTAARECRRRAG